MKVFWQQLIGFLVVIFAAMFLFAFRIESDISSYIIATREEQLLNYGNNIVNNNFSREDLVRASQLLASENIIIQVYLDDGRTIYPNYDQRFDSNLSQDDLETIKSGQYLGFRTVDRLNNQSKEIEPFLTVYLPHQDVGQFPAGFISLAAPLNDFQQQINSMRNNIFQSLIIAILIGVLISIIYSIVQTRKLRKLQEATKEIAQGNYVLEIDTQGQDEFADLARGFKFMAESLQASQEEISRQEEIRRQFMMDVAHEMRTPLTTMGGLVEGLQHGLIPQEKQTRSLELIRKETQRLTRLVNENLDYEKIRNRQINLNKTKIQGQTLFNQIQTQLASKAQQKGNTIIIECPPEVIIYADYDRIVQIIINLVTNAIQFSQDSPIKLIGKMTPDHTVIQVVDQGIGIDSAQINRIWERFYKVDVSRRNTEFGESGIGLAVVKSLVEAHDGHVEVDSQLGKGTTFTVLLPHKK